jgi:hypothetical protein
MMILGGFEFAVPKRACGHNNRGFKFTALVRDEHYGRKLMAKTSPSKGSRAPSLRVVSGGRNAQSNEDKSTGGRDASATKGKRVQFDLETWHALDMLARGRMMTFQELADEAFADLLRKHGQPVDLKDALKRSLHDGEGPRRKAGRKRGARQSPE